MDEKHGHIDVLFANGGIAKLGSVESTPEEVVDELFNTNFRGNYFTVQKVLPLLKDGGRTQLKGATAGVEQDGTPLHQSMPNKAFG